MANSDLTNRRIAVGVGVVALIVGSQIFLSDSQDDFSPVLHDGNGVIVGGLIENVLDDRDGSAFEGGPTAGEVFETAQGITCRTFTQGDVDGTACDVGGEWRIVEMRQRVPGVELPSGEAAPAKEARDAGEDRSGDAPTEPEAPEAPDAPQPD